MSTLSFTAVMQLRGVNPYVLVTKEQVALLRPDGRKPIPVTVQVNGHPAKPWHINMMPVGDGAYYLYLHGDVRKASATGVGDEVAIELDFDPSYRNGPMHPMPDEFAVALGQQPAAKRNWDTLSPSRQKEVLRYLATLRSPEARSRNFERAMKALSGEPIRFMGRSWGDPT